MQTEGMTSQPVPLDVHVIGNRGAAIFAAVQAHELYARLTESSLAYSDCWFTNTGFATVSQWDQEKDAPVLAIEGLKVLALKAAVFEATGDEVRAELLVPSPVDEMIHAILAQPNVLRRIEADLRVQFVHATELEEFRYEFGGETDALYETAGFGPKPLRYWLPASEVGRRLAAMEAGLETAGVIGFGKRTTHRFDDTVAPAAV
ncbi:hypothetical protein [Actinoplanes sp. NBRC 101535]|uniref:hypothetical protein n=1 Tax=Actinoplanes sp. NBRC 101535 TaxID=3032196 RepID=UPI0024A0C300|nr:hypothetical protein [Actinoplanes sp. NBRC 101535]GLY03782.1 hypothetical protein Acsp01_41610 [Actinoplanes sp. NBRC 101535]